MFSYNPPLTPKLPHTGCVTLTIVNGIGQEPLGGMHVIILRLIHRLGVRKVSTEYRESETR